MTRINIAIPAHELCDQHLIAEYRELPRCWRHMDWAATRTDAQRSTMPMLGAGHEKWCSMFQGTLCRRWLSIVNEMLTRGFKPQHRHAPHRALYGHYWSIGQAKYGQQLLRSRICDRLRTMKREPRWTGCEPPEWCLSALSDRLCIV